MVLSAGSNSVGNDFSLQREMKLLGAARFIAHKIIALSTA